MELLFLIIAGLKSLYSLVQAVLNLRMLLTDNFKLAQASDEKLAALIRYHKLLVTIEAIAATSMLMPLLIGMEQMQDMILGFFLWFLSGAIEDFTAILVHRSEQKRRGSPAP